jgi:hypothetical protein
LGHRDLLVREVKLVRKEYPADRGHQVHRVRPDQRVWPPRPESCA